jgi:glucose uptake protein GlcU
LKRLLVFFTFMAFWFAFVNWFLRLAARMEGRPISFYFSAFAVLVILILGPMIAVMLIRRRADLKTAAIGSGISVLIGLGAKLLLIAYLN